MDSTRVTEHPTSHERRQPSAARPTAPADPRGALLRTPEPPAQGSPGLPAQGRPAEAPAPPGIPGAPASDGPCPAGSPTPPGSLAAATGTPAASGTPAGSQGPPAPSGGHGPTDAPAGSGPEHSQPSVTEPDPHRPRPAPETIPVQSGAEASAVQSGKERRTGQGPAPGTPMPMRRDGDRLRFVGAATRRIARGIDLDEIVMGLCRATVPTFSDAILVYLRDPLPVGDERPTGPVVLRLRRTDRIPEDRDTEGFLLPALQPEPDLGITAELCTVRPGGALNEVLRGVRPVFADAPAARAALPELIGEDLTVPGGQRAILAPLRGRRRVIGAALFLRRPDRPAFETDDLLVAAQLATHSALGIDKAVLYGREAYIADELQRTMLPETLPRPTGVRLASRYLPAAETARVGGDWYDAIPLPGSRVALVVGDVMGHSMTSAAIMGQLRTTAQTLAGLDLPPQEVLHHLDEQAQRLGTDRMATCLYAVYDPVAHRITIANAGHPPPVLLHLGGRAEVLRVPPGAPIGVGGVDFEAVELDAPAGATLLLYTDGLV
ncbi:PP2C family protein-serine/threonine phosphatase, partial [Streptomyces phaeochromogenes]|uniref:PP2C family protein-serine/threonine phosphatase n=1 Tax=Streptomyces phaeochromogenes TaxID=1923 RepID=UPI0036BD0243